MNRNEKCPQSVATPEPKPSFARTEEFIRLPSHLIRLPGGSWSLWRWVCLRGAGLPAAQVLKLSTPICAQAADQLIHAEDEARHRQDRALAFVRETLDALRWDNQWENAEKRNPLIDAMRKLKKNILPKEVNISDEISSAIDEFRTASARRDTAFVNFNQMFKNALIQLSRSLHEVALSSRFREAVIWQNRQAFHSAIIPFLHTPHEADRGRSKQKQYKELIANYLQRYCVKNDTIGFFGPVGWARLVSQGEALAIRPGLSLLATRNVYFEAWCIDALAEILSGNTALRPWIAPRPVPYLHLNGTTLLLPLAHPIPLIPQLAMALKLCDGERIAKEIATALMKSFPRELKNEFAAYELLEQLNAKRWISWKIDIPVQLFPEIALQKLLERVEDVSIRSSALEAIEVLKSGRDAVAHAAGNPEKLDRALADLDISFMRLSGVPSTRSDGKMYAARTLVYEDCRRDIEVELGPELLQYLGPPLSLLLTSARWFTYQVAEYYRKLFKEIYLELARRHNSPVVDCAAFWYRLQPIMFDKNRSGSNTVLQTFQQHWAEILFIPEGQHCVSYSVEQLRPHIQARFDAPKAGWSSARYHCPDLMIAAADVNAVRRGDYQFVLGELHLGTNTLRGSMFVSQHPHPEEILRAYELDMPQRSVRIAPPKNWPGLTARTKPTLSPSKNYRLLVTHDSLCDPGAYPLPIGSLVIEEIGGQLFMRTRDKTMQFDIIEAFSDIFANQTADKFKVIKAYRHTPRITFDRLVISRESWAFSPAEFSFAYEKDDAERFLSARRWARTHDMPRFVFVRSPVERKPLYVDFESPIYIDIFAKIARRTKESDHAESLISVSEMLPDHNETWLIDAEGQRYTSEFRLVAVDSGNEV